MSVAQAEEILRLLPQVTGCRIRTDERGAPVAVLITAAAGSDPQAILADVITVLGARAGMDVLDDQVRVVVLDEPQEFETILEEPGVLEALEHEGRVRLHSFDLRVDAERTRAQVELALGAHVYQGRAECRGDGEVPELLAQATLDGLEKLCHERVALRLVGFRRAVVGTDEVVCVTVRESRGREQRLFAGSARIGDDLGRAAAYAVLDSMNRRLGAILAGPPLDYEIDSP